MSMRLLLWLLTFGRLVLIPVFIAMASAAQATARAGGDPTVQR